MVWYKNWLTCDVCIGWAETFKTIATKEMYLKMLKGLMWTLCTLENSESFCKVYVNDVVDRLETDIFTVGLSGGFICGNLFDFCEGSTS
jgi:hypothetical protein